MALHTPLVEAHHTVQDAFDQIAKRIPDYNRSQGPVWNILGFGASTGAADNSSALQNAVTQAGTTKGTVFVPDGTFSYATAPTWAAGASLAGTGQGAVLSYTGSSNAINFGSQALDVDDPWTGMSIRNLRLSGTSSATGGIKVRGVTRWAIQDCRIDGFTNGYGILLNGASFIGRISGGRIKGNSIGISAKKQGGDGSAGEGQAFNAIEVCGGLEIQNNGYGIQLGDPSSTETTPVVGQGAEIHGITIEGNSSGGLHNVSAYNVHTHSNYFEGDSTFEYREGASGNTIKPVGCVFSDNFLNVTCNTPVDLVRSERSHIERNHIIAASSAGKTAFTTAATNVNYAFINGNFVNNLATEITNNGNYTIYRKSDQGGGAFPFENSTAFLFSAANYTPTSSTDTNGAVGMLTWDNSYIYVRCPDGKWRRLNAALATF